MSEIRSTEERIAELDKKMEQIKAQKKAILQREKEIQRKARTKRLIEVGGARTPFSSSATLHSKLYLTYAHQKPGASISFGISSSGSNVGVSITGGKYDQQSLSYTYH